MLKIIVCDDDERDLDRMTELVEAYRSTHQDKEMKQAAIKIPASNKLSGRICSVRLTVASIAPICFALCK